VKGPVEGKREVSNVIASNIGTVYHDDPAGSLVNPELLADYLSGTSRLGIRRVESSVAVYYHALYLENGWDAGY
jgi:hypothetical protein